MHAGASARFVRIGHASGGSGPAGSNHSKTRGRTTALPEQQKTENGNEAINAPPHPRGVVLRRLAGIRAGESAASPSRTSGFSPSGDMPTRPCA